MALADADRRERDVELLAVIIRSLTAILTAWTGFQSSKWSGVMSISFNMAGASRTESVRQANIAGQQVNLDVGVFLAWVEAVAEEAYAREARRSIQRSDNYVITTILFATVLFFAALSSKLTHLRNRQILLGFAIVVLLVGIGIVLSYPIEV